MDQKKFGIGVVALSLPSVGAREKRVESAIDYLRQKGFSLRIGSTVFSEYSYRSASISDRANDLMKMFCDSNVQCILNTTGGFNSNELLDTLDFDLIQKNPKWFVGYSDITAINLALFKKIGLRSVSGPMLVDYADDPTVFDRLFQCLESERSNFSLPEYLHEWDRASMRACPKMQCLSAKAPRCEGKLISGNLSTFMLLAGTPYFPDCAGAILMLEYDVCEDFGLASVQRMLRQLRQTGVFDRIAGLVLGVLPAKTHLEEQDEWNLRDILDEVTAGYQFPVIFDAPFGHVYPSWILINGTRLGISVTPNGVESIIRFTQDFPD